jgi:ABC-type branched-subunit amino acid transport system substrate-binding protein
LKSYSARSFLEQIGTGGRSHDDASFIFAIRAAAALVVDGRSAGAADAPGVADTEIKIGQTIPYSGPLSSRSVLGRTEAAYFKMINEQGGINGRRLNFITVDDAYSPSKTVEQTRRLVEQEQVALLFNSLGTPTNAAIQHYCNDNKVPQLFVSTGASMFSDPEHFPWTIGFNPSCVPRLASTPNTFSRRSRMRKSGCSIKTTISARTI